jgi:N utilization substance protein B
MSDVIDDGMDGEEPKKAAPKKLSNNDKRKMKSASRLYAVQALYQMEQSGTNVDRVKQEFLDYRFGAPVLDGDEGEEMAEGDFPFFSKILDGAVNWQAKIDQMTDRALVAKWPIARIDPVLRGLFRAAGAEFVEMDTPPKVVIVEYVDVAVAFFPDGKEPKFVNAVLDHMAREARPEAF